MSHIRKGHIVPAPQWAKHLRPYWRRLFWHKHRAAERRMIRLELNPARQWHR